MITLTLPWPPSVNHYYRHVGPRTLISRAGRTYRRRVVRGIHGIHPLTGALAVQIDAHPPDHRRRDTDNLLKSVLDALQHAGLYDDDSQIEDLHIQRKGVVPEGQLIVQIAEVIAA